MMQEEFMVYYLVFQKVCVMHFNLVPNEYSTS